MGILENQTIFDDVITGQKWRWIKKSFGGLQDTGLNFHIKQSDLDFRPLEALWIFIIEAMFSILRLKKIDQNRLESDNKKLFYTNSSTQNSMSWSVFSFNELGRSVKLKLRVTNVNEQQFLNQWCKYFPFSFTSCFQFMPVSVTKSAKLSRSRIDALKIKLNTPHLSSPTELWHNI